MSGHACLHVCLVDTTYQRHTTTLKVTNIKLSGFMKSMWNVDEKLISYMRDEGGELGLVILVVYNSKFSRSR